MACGREDLSTRTALLLAVDESGNLERLVCTFFHNFSLVHRSLRV